MLLKRNQGKLNFVLSYEMKSEKNRFSLAEADKKDTKIMVQGARCVVEEKSEIFVRSSEFGVRS
jgi:hypothetical protein